MTMQKQKTPTKRPESGKVIHETAKAPSQERGGLAALAKLLFGKPLASSEERAEKIGSGAAIPIFGLDALSSAAYGPEAALTLLSRWARLESRTLCPSASAS